MLRELPLTESMALPPGTFFLYLDLPSQALDRMARDPSWREEVGAKLAEPYGSLVVFEGGGPTWISDNGVPRRLFSMRIRVLGPSDGVGAAHEAQFAYATAVAALVPIAVIVSAVAAAIIVWRLTEAPIRAVKVFELATPEQRDEIFNSINWMVRAATFAAVAVTVGVGAFVLQRAGVLA